MTKYQCFQKIIRDISKKEGEPDKDALEICQRIFDAGHASGKQDGIALCIQSLAGRHGAAVTHELHLLLKSAHSRKEGSHD